MPSPLTSRVPSQRTPRKLPRPGRAARAGASDSVSSTEIAESSDSGSVQTSSLPGRDAAFEIVRGARLVRRLDRHFRLPEDSHTDRMIKIVTFLSHVILMLIALFVGVFFVAASGEWIVGIVPILFASLLLALGSYNWYTHGIHALTLAHVQLIAVILLPATMHVQLAGFEFSGHQLHFVVMGPALASVIFRGNSGIVSMYLALASIVTIVAVLLTEFDLVPNDSALFSAAGPISHTASMVSYLFSLLVPPLGMGFVLVFHTRSMALLNMARQSAMDSAAAALHDATQEREANAAKTRFVSVMSHEIRNPLTGIIICAEMLQRTSLSSRQKFYCEGIDRASQVLLGIVNNVLDMTKIEAGSVTLERVRFNLLEATQLVLQSVAPSAALKDLDLVLIAPPGECYEVYGDPTRYRQVLHNLVGNAIKFTVTGHVSVTLEQQQQPRKCSAQWAAGEPYEHDEEPATTSYGASPSTSTSWREGHLLTSAKSGRSQSLGQVWRVSVQDTGIGISAEGRRKLFKEFSQVDASTTREHGGTGLGLFICKQLVQLMGGTIQVNSVVGQGTEFTFTLEVETGSTRRDAHTVAQLPNTESAWSVIVLCNTDLVRSSVEMYVKHFFRRVTCEMPRFYSTGAALRLLRARISSTDDGMLPQRTIVIVDSVVCTPELERLLVTAPNERVVPIMLSSAVGINAGRVDLAAAGWRYFLDKPVLPGPLCAVLTGICASTAGSNVSSPRSRDMRWTKPGLRRESSSRRSRVDGPNDDAPTVLVVDDMDMVRELVRCLLEEDLGYRTLTAANGAEAVKLVTSGVHNIALVLMDVEMPVMDGKEATRRIREWEAQQGLGAVPICAMTGNAMREDMQEALQCGMTMFLAKPVSRSKLASIIEAYAPLPSAMAPVSEKPKRRSGAKSATAKKRKAKRGAKKGM